MPQRSKDARPEKDTPVNGAFSVPSTTFEWRQVKISRPAGGQKNSAPKALRWFGLPRRNPRDPLHLTIKYRGGPECWVEVHARGRIGRFPGTIQLVDLVKMVNSDL